MFGDGTGLGRIRIANSVFESNSCGSLGGATSTAAAASIYLGPATAEVWNTLFLSNTCIGDGSSIVTDDAHVRNTT